MLHYQLCVINSYLLITALTDLFFWKLPNLLTLALLPFFMAYRYFIFGWVGLREALIVIILVPIVLWYPFIRRGLGAGDIKFLINLGVLVGLEDLWNCFVFGVICTIPVLLYHSFRHRERIYYFIQTGEIMPSASPEDLVKIAYIPPLAFGAFMYLNYRSLFS